MPKNTYTLKDGTIVPGVTTITRQLDKPALLDWAWRLGKEGKDWREQRDSAGDKGTDVHDMILKFWQGEEVPMVGDVQTKCFESFLKWPDLTHFHPLLLETPLVSEKHGFGGQPDGHGLMVTNRRERLVDIKTSKGIYEEMWYQLAGYAILLREHGYHPKEFQILRVGQDGTFECPVKTNLKAETRIFLHLLGIWYDRRTNE